ncbi:MAG: LysM peptidoglycan-binding domain-containing protein [Planctomycetes bacterium]|nr:LysM peptidoglycan-binding domain-containing protein [Planctomycetota bacterium]
MSDSFERGNPEPLSSFSSESLAGSVSKIDDRLSSLSGALDKLRTVLEAQEQADSGLSARMDRHDYFLNSLKADLKEGLEKFSDEGVRLDLRLKAFESRIAELEGNDSEALLGMVQEELSGLHRDLSALSFGVDQRYQENRVLMETQAREVGEVQSRVSGFEEALEGVRRENESLQQICREAFGGLESWRESAAGFQNKISGLEEELGALLSVQNGMRMLCHEIRDSGADLRENLLGLQAEQEARVGELKAKVEELAVLSAGEGVLHADQLEGRIERERQELAASLDQRFLVEREEQRTQDGELIREEFSRILETLDEWMGKERATLIATVEESASANRQEIFAQLEERFASSHLEGLRAVEELVNTLRHENQVEHAGLAEASLSSVGALLEEKVSALRQGMEGGLQELSSRTESRLEAIRGELEEGRNFSEAQRDQLGAMEAQFAALAEKGEHFEQGQSELRAALSAEMERQLELINSREQQLREELHGLLAKVSQEGEGTELRDIREGLRAYRQHIEKQETWTQDTEKMIQEIEKFTSEQEKVVVVLKNDQTAHRDEIREARKEIQRLGNQLYENSRNQKWAWSAAAALVMVGFFTMPFFMERSPREGLDLQMAMNESEMRAGAVEVASMDPVAPPSAATGTEGDLDVLALSAPALSGELALDGEALAEVGEPRSSSTWTAEPAKQASESSAQGKNIIYVVKKNERLWDIAKRFYGSGDKHVKIMRDNNLKNSTIHPGDELRISL